MVDLSHWDFLDEFELAEVAALIAGVEPKYGKKKLDEASGIPSPIRKRVMDAAFAAFQCQKKQEPVPTDCLKSNMLKIFDEKKGFLATIADMALGGDDVVVQRDEVARWLNAIGLQSKYAFEREAKAQGADELINAPLLTRERHTLLTIIAALCNEARIPYDKPAKAAGMIQSTAATMGISIGETTIEGHLKKIPDALATRMK